MTYLLVDNIFLITTFKHTIIKLNMELNYKSYAKQYPFYTYPNPIFEHSLKKLRFIKPYLSKGKFNKVNKKYNNKKLAVYLLVPKPENIGDKTRTCKVKSYSVLSGTWLPNFSTPIARDKT